MPACLQQAAAQTAGTASLCETVTVASLDDYNIAPRFKLKCMLPVHGCGTNCLCLIPSLERGTLCAPLVPLDISRCTHCAVSKSQSSLQHAIVQSNAWCYMVDAGRLALLMQLWMQAANMLYAAVRSKSKFAGHGGASRQTPVSCEALVYSLPDAFSRSPAPRASRSLVAVSTWPAERLPF